MTGSGLTPPIPPPNGSVSWPNGITPQPQHQPKTDHNLGIAEGEKVLLKQDIITARTGYPTTRVAGSECVVVVPSNGTCLVGVRPSTMIDAQWFYVKLDEIDLVGVGSERRPESSG